MNNDIWFCKRCSRFNLSDTDDCEHGCGYSRKIKIWNIISYKCVKCHTMHTFELHGCNKFFNKCMKCNNHLDRSQVIV